jgi:cell division protease FtsH
MVPLPDINGREEILKVHTGHVALNKDVELSVIAKGTPGFAGADLANLVNEAALWAARQNKTTVDHEDFEFAKDKVMMGPERRSILIPEAERRVTAYHEAGHALVAELIEEVDPVHKVTIIPRGQSLGLTQLLPEEDRHSYKRGQLLGQIAMMLGGRAAEQIAFSQFTTGASNDIKRATELARRMVVQWGMSDLLGPVALSDGHDNVFLGRDLIQHKRYSQVTAKKIDQEVKSIISKCYDRAMKLLKKNNKILVSLAERLIERETVDRAEILNLLKPASKRTATA